MADTLFPLSPLIPSKAGSSRGDTWSRLAAQRLAKMHRQHGYGPADTPCKDCTHLSRHSNYSGKKTWLKCEKSHVSASDATDWRAGWPSCGLYEEAKP